MLLEAEEIVRFFMHSRLSGEASRIDIEIVQLKLAGYDPVPWEMLIADPVYPRPHSHEERFQSEKEKAENCTTRGV